MTKSETLKVRWLREDEEAIDSAIDALLQHTHGRKLLWWMLSIGKVHNQPFTGNALSTAFNCGELNVGQQFLERVTLVSAEGYMNMMKEMADERRERERQLDLATRGGGRNGDGGYDTSDDAAERDDDGRSAED